VLRALGYAVALLLLFAAPALPQADSSADAVVVARVVGSPGPWPDCGILSVKGEVVFETVRSERGEVPERFVAVVQCPGHMRWGGVQRLRLAGPLPGASNAHPPLAPGDLPRYRLIDRELAEAPAGLARFLGEHRRELYRTYQSNGTRGGWTVYGSVLAARVENRRVVALRATLPRSMSCTEAAEWMGFDEAGPPLRRRDGCEWPGLSERHRLAPGVRGQLEDGVFEVRLR
jgi:hypothetical protein